MPSTFIARKEEQLILKEALDSPEAEMVAVIGRWRVGKTCLVTSVYENQIAFSVTGIQNSALEDQLERFSKSIKKYSDAKIDLPIPKNWFPGDYGNYGLSNGSPFIHFQFTHYFQLSLSFIKLLSKRM